MEDQQPGSGDVIGTTPDVGAPPACGGQPAADGAAETLPASDPGDDGQSEEAATVSVDVVAAGVDPSVDTDANAADEVTAETVVEAGGGAAKPRTGRRLAAAVAVSVALFVGSAAFAGAAVQPYLADRALVATKLEVVRTATKAITTLWNYTPENMDTLADRASVYLSGDLEAEYRKFLDAIAPANKQAKVTDTTEITGAAVESLEGPEATVIVYTNTSATSELTKAIPSLKYLSYRLTMRRGDNRWLVTKMPTITSLDLTPRL